MHDGFFEPDEGEVHLDKPVTELTAQELLRYALYMFEQTMGFRYAVNWPKDFRTFDWLVNTYGQRESGLMIKWLFYRYQGVFDNETFAPSWFCAPRKWWIDQRRAEVMKVIVAKRKQSHEPKVDGLNRIEALSLAAASQKVSQ